MRLLILSDLHLDSWRDHAPRIDTSVSKPDIVVLAGDIHTKARGPAWAAETFAKIPVLYVAGNHEFYGGAIDEVGDSIRQECAYYENVHYLDCDQYTFADVRFLGATLWTDFALCSSDHMLSMMLNAHTVMHDYRSIKVAAAGYRKLHPEDTAQLHAAHKGWLERKLAEPFAGSTVVVSHMAPSIRSIDAKDVKKLISAAYASNLDSVVANADIWIHGHLHKSLDYKLGRCRVVANPRGYRSEGGHPENKQFDPEFIVELKGKEALNK